VPVSDGVRAAIEKALSGHPVAKWALTSWGCVQFLCVVPDSVLDDDGRFRQQVAAVNALGDLAIAAVQRAFGGFTGEQQRVLAGWRGRNDEIEAMLTSVASEVGGKILSHGWDPRHESLPLLVVEEKVPGGWANRFATVDATGMVRLRTTVPVSQDGERGHSLRSRPSRWCTTRHPV